MIKLIDSLPEKNFGAVEYIKIKNTFDTYRDIALFWSQEDKIFISLLDGNMVIFNLDGDLEELDVFLKMMSPKSIFTDTVTAEKLGLKGKNAYVGVLNCGVTGETKSDVLSSKEIYEIFKKSGLSLPPYEPFAVDICRKLNHKTATCFGVKNTAVAVGISADGMFLINGIASLKKGCGTRVLKGLLAENSGKICFACFEENVKGFYLKNNFEILYKVTYWEK